MKYRKLIVVVLILTCLVSLGLNFFRYSLVFGNDSGLVTTPAIEQRLKTPEYCIAAGDSIGYEVRGVPFINLVDRGDCNGNNTAYPLAYILNTALVLIVLGLAGYGYARMSSRIKQTRGVFGVSAALVVVGIGMITWSVVGFRQYYYDTTPSVAGPSVDVTEFGGSGVNVKEGVDDGIMDTPIKFSYGWPLQTATGFEYDDEPGRISTVYPASVILNSLTTLVPLTLTLIIINTKRRRT